MKIAWQKQKQKTAQQVSEFMVLDTNLSYISLKLKLYPISKSSKIKLQSKQIE
jgi:hypothetical protein